MTNWLNKTMDVRSKYKMKRPDIPDYSGSPCKSIVAENISAVKKGKELTAPLAYLNKSCEFKKKYEMIVGDITHLADKKAYLKEYYSRPDVKAKVSEYHRMAYLKRKLEKDK